MNLFSFGRYKFSRLVCENRGLKIGIIFCLEFNGSGALQTMIYELDESSQI